MELRCVFSAGSLSDVSGEFKGRKRSLGKNKITIKLGTQSLILARTPILANGLELQLIDQLAAQCHAQTGIGLSLRLQPTRPVSRLVRILSLPDLTGKIVLQLGEESLLSGLKMQAARLAKNQRPVGLCFVRNVRSNCQSRSRRSFQSSWIRLGLEPGT